MIRPREPRAALGTPLHHLAPLRALFPIEIGAPGPRPTATAGAALASAIPPRPPRFQLHGSTQRVGTPHQALHA